MAPPALPHKSGSSAKVRSFTQKPKPSTAGALRLEHKQASLEELGQLHEPPLTKDAIAGRIRRLLAMADKRAEELGIPDTEANLTPEMMAEGS